MPKIYHRETLPSNTARKKKDEHARKRNVIMNFRVSPIEKELINARIRATGLSKSAFFIESCLYQKVLVKGNIKTFTIMKNEIMKIFSLLDKSSYDINSLKADDIGSFRIIIEIIERRLRSNNRK
jgi:hypothetical protein